MAGGGTLLDQALIVWGTEIDNGNSHDHFDMPFVLAGGGAGQAEPRHRGGLPALDQLRRHAVHEPARACAITPTCC